MKIPLHQTVHEAIAGYEAAYYSSRSAQTRLTFPRAAESTVAMAGALLNLVRSGASTSSGVRVFTRAQPVQVITEMLATVSGISLETISTRRLESFEWARITLAARCVAESGIQFHETPTFFDIVELLGHIERGSNCFIDCRLLSGDEEAGLQNFACKRDFNIVIYSSQGQRAESR